MFNRNAFLICLTLALVSAATFSFASVPGAAAPGHGRYDIKMLGLTVCIVDRTENKAYLYKESKDREALELFRAIDLTGAGKNRIDYVRPEKSAK